MRGCTSSFGCLIYIFITFWALVLTMFLIATSQWLFDRDFYVETLTDDGLIDAIYDDGLPRLYNEHVFFRQVTEGDESNAVFGQSLREIAPKEYVTSEITDAIDAVIAYIQGDVQRLDHRLNTQVVRENLNDPSRANQFAQALVERLPACDVDGQLYYGKSNLPACIPSGMTAEQMAGQVRENLASLGASIPDEIQWFDAPRRSSDIPKFKFSDITTTTTQGLMVLAGGILFITALMGANGLRSFLRRFSFMLIIPALILLWGGQELAKLSDHPQVLNGVTVTLNDEEIEEGPIVDAIKDFLFNISERAGTDIKNVSQVAVIIALVIFGLSLLPMPGSGRGLDSTLNLPPSGKVGRMATNHQSPIQGI